MIFFKLIDYYKLSDIYISHNNCLGQMLITLPSYYKIYYKVCYKEPFVNLGIGIGIGIGTDITNVIISSSIRPMDPKLSRVVT